LQQENFGDKGYAGYRVGDHVKEHNGWGIVSACLLKSEMDFFAVVYRVVFGNDYLSPQHCPSEVKPFAH
jgi:hypothetical protein